MGPDWASNIAAFRTNFPKEHYTLQDFEAGEIEENSVFQRKVLGASIEENRFVYYYVSDRGSEDISYKLSADLDGTWDRALAEWDARRRSRGWWTGFDAKRKDSAKAVATVDASAEGDKPREEEDELGRELKAAVAMSGKESLDEIPDPLSLLALPKRRE